MIRHLNVARFAAGKIGLRRLPRLTDQRSCDRLDAAQHLHPEARLRCDCWRQPVRNSADDVLPKLRDVCDEFRIRRLIALCGRGADQSGALLWASMRESAKCPSAKPV